MKQFKFIEDYAEYKEGDVIEMKKEIYHTIIHPLLMRGVLKVIHSDKKIREKVEEEIEEIKSSENSSVIGKLLSKKMRDLQKFGKKYGALDTKKSELVEEILEKAPLKDIKDYVGE